MLLIKNPIAQFFTLDGDPLDNGSVYIGTPGLNPETNPVAIYWDRDGLIPAAQPVKTSRGYISNNGTPARIYINDPDYSVNVRDKNGVLIYSSLSVTGESIGPLSGTNGAGEIGYDNSTSSLTATNVQDAIDEIAASPKVDKAGDTMTGPLNVPSGASGTQVPQAQETVGRTSSTGSARMPYGNTAQRDASPSNGFARVNSDFDALEHRGPNGWKQYGIVSTAAFDANTGTSHEITGIPVWAKRIRLHLLEVSTNGTGNILVQVGDATSMVTSGYTGSSIGLTSGVVPVAATSSSGVPIYRNGTGNTSTGYFDFVKLPGSGTWKITGVVSRNTTGSATLSFGFVTMTDDLKRIGITRTGADQFDDSGKIWATWEG